MFEYKSCICFLRYSLNEPPSQHEQHIIWLPLKLFTETKYVIIKLHIKPCIIKYPNTSLLYIIEYHLHLILMPRRWYHCTLWMYKNPSSFIGKSEKMLAGLPLVTNPTILHARPTDNFDTSCIDFSHHPNYCMFLCSHKVKNYIFNLYWSYMSLFDLPLSKSLTHTSLKSTWPLKGVVTI